ncbi:MAG: hypothetical protein MR779_02735 [Tenericutes bacterium]|nr:hypothetical protein [Mycoplasmatota bacterium]
MTEEQIISLLLTENEELYKRLSLSNKSDLENLKNILKKFDINTIIANFNVLTDLDLSEEEKGLIDTLKNLDANVLKYILDLGLDEKQEKILSDIKNKVETKITELESINEETIKERINYNKILLSKIKNKTINLIDSRDISYIVELLVKNGFQVSAQIEVLKLINKINLDIYSNIDVEEVISSEKEETNIDKDELIKILSAHKIDFNSLKEENRTKLIKYGVLSQIEEILCTLEEQGLHNIKSREDILVNILIYSSKKIIDDNMKLVKERNIVSLAYINPTMFYPAMKVVTNKRPYIKSGPTPGERTSKTSGSSNFLKGNIELLDELGIDPEEVYSKCATYFYGNPKLKRRLLKNLELYGINLRDNLSSYALLSTGAAVLDTLDKAIENGAYEYCLEYQSRLGSNNRVNYYRIKYAKKLYEEGNPLGRKTPFNARYVNAKGRETYVLASDFTKATSEKYGSEEQDTKRLYGSKEIAVENQELISTILSNSRCDVITDISRLNSKIVSLDKLYMSEDGITYNFNGVIISRNKVLRYAEKLITSPNIELTDSTLLYIITRNSMLDENELNIIKECTSKIDDIRSLQ